MPRVAKAKQNPSEEREEVIGFFSMAAGDGITSWHVAKIERGVESKRAYSHTPLYDKNNQEIIFTSKATARAFADGYNLCLADLEDQA